MSTSSVLFRTILQNVKCPYNVILLACSTAGLSDNALPHNLTNPFILGEHFSLSFAVFLCVLAGLD